MRFPVRRARSSPVIMRPPSGAPRPRARSRTPPATGSRRSLAMESGRRRRRSRCRRLRRLLRSPRVARDIGDLPPLVPAGSCAPAVIALRSFSNFPISASARRFLPHRFPTPSPASARPGEERVHRLPDLFPLMENARAPAPRSASAPPCGATPPRRKSPSGPRPPSSSRREDLADPSPAQRASPRSGSGRSPVQVRTSPHPRSPANVCGCARGGRPAGRSSASPGR